MLVIQVDLTKLDIKSLLEEAAEVLKEVAVEELAAIEKEKLQATQQAQLQLLH
jgi:hypothetical protein